MHGIDAIAQGVQALITTENPASAGPKSPYNPFLSRGVEERNNLKLGKASQGLPQPGESLPASVLRADSNDCHVWQRARGQTRKAVRGCEHSDSAKTAVL